MRRLRGGLRPLLALDPASRAVELHHLEPERNTIPGDVDLVA